MKELLQFHITVKSLINGLSGKLQASENQKINRKTENKTGNDDSIGKSAFVFLGRPKEIER